MMNLPDFSQLAPVVILCLVGSFLLCGIPFGYILGELAGKGDIRKSGSGNIGTTNALRVAGPKVAALTLLCDCVKGVISVNLSRLAIAHICLGGQAELLAPEAPLDYIMGLVLFTSISGHIFSPYLHFKGGKGIACGLGVLLGWYWPIGLGLLAIFLVGVIVTRYVSVGSIMAAIGAPTLTVIFFPYASFALKVTIALLGALVVWAHRSNINKLMHGTESKLSFGGKKGA